MSAYVILEVNVTDPEAYEEYKKQSGPALEPFGGRFLVRGGTAETLEGDWNPERIVVLRFETSARAREWYHSDTYAGPKAVRRAASEGRMILVEGV